jgi:hypothetical protein
LPDYSAPSNAWRTGAAGNPRSKNAWVSLCASAKLVAGERSGWPYAAGQAGGIKAAQKTRRFAMRVSIDTVYLLYELNPLMAALLGRALERAARHDGIRPASCSDHVRWKSFAQKSPSSAAGWARVRRRSQRRDSDVASS